MKAASIMLSIKTLPALVLFGALGTALAQQSGMPSAPATFPIRGFDLSGEVPLSGDETTRILAPYIRADGTLESLKKAGAALEEAFKAKGFPQYRVTLPPQELGSKASFNGIKFVISKVQGSGTAVAQQNVMPPATGATTTFAIRGFELRGDVPLSGDETTRILAPYIRADGTLESLQKAGAALEEAFKAKGYALHRVTLPPQEVGNKVTFNVIKFVIGKVTVENPGSFSEANIRASVPEIKEGEAPNFHKLAVQTAIANENPSKQLQVALKESDEAEKIDVRLVVKPSNPLSLSASLSNTGSDATGNDRLALVGSHSNLFGLDHQGSFAYTTSVERSDRVKQFGLNYRIPLYRYGGVVGMSYTNSDVVGDFGSFKSSGAGETYGLNYNHYFAPEGGHKTYFTAALDQKLFNASKINDVAIPGQLDRGSMPLTLSYSVKVEEDAAVWGYSADFAKNIPGSTGNNLDAYKTEDARIEIVNWNIAHLNANYLSAVGKSGWLVGARGQLQYTGDALISGEQFGLGGVSSVRGVGERVLSGDRGASLSIEVTTPEVYKGMRLLSFVDAGWLNSVNTTASSTSKVETDQLASAGLGLRYGVGWASLTADWGRVITGANIPVSAGPNSNLPKVGDEKLHINLTARF
jgi:hemolysin activation/secretion protein